MRIRLFTYTTLFFVLINAANAQRIDKTINSGWFFHQGEVKVTNTLENPDAWARVNLPHTWNCYDDSDEERGYYRGAGWYAKVLTVPLAWKTKQVFLHFEGANQETEIFVNGEIIGNHKGGYTAFRFNLSSYLHFGENNLVMVRVTNQHNDDIPPLRADYTFYGGIYRNVRLIVTESIHFDMENYASEGVFTEILEVSEQKATFLVHGSIFNRLDMLRKIRLQLLVRDNNQEVVLSKNYEVNISARGVYEFNSGNLIIPNPKLWSPDNPYLYHINVRIYPKGEGKKLMDEVVLPLGLRWFEFDDQNRFVLNGKPIKLVGTNRHQDLPEKGNALSDDDHRNDFKKIKELGFNFVRLAHYPQAKEVYRMCDKLGLLVWTEIPIVVYITESAAFTSNSLNMQREHIRQTKNHPSVVFYGYMNELMLRFNRMTEEERKQAAAATVELANKLDALSKKEAPGRKTVMAAHFYEGYNKYGLADVADVLGWNLYFGWYYQEMEDLSQFLKEQHKQYPDRPLIVSEYGPGADIRNHSESPIAWDFTEDYQLRMHESYLDQMMNIPYLGGFAAWNFADFGSERRDDAIPTVNQKGLMNFDRTDKEVSNLYRAYFSSKPVLHIALRNQKMQNGIEDEMGKGTSTRAVKIFSNANEVELLLNGKSLGEQVVKAHVALFDVPFTNGRNELEAIDNNGLQDKVTIEYNLYTIPLQKGINHEIAVNVGAHFSFFDPVGTVLWMADREYTPGLWGYQGGKPLIRTGGRQPKAGISDNILGTDSNPLFQTFNEGIEGYQFDVKDGHYEITLCFVEPDSDNPAGEVIYNLSDDKPESGSVAGSRIFGIEINGIRVLNNLNLASDFGALRAVTFKYQVNVKGEGIKLRFIQQKGKPILSGIRVKPL